MKKRLFFLIVITTLLLGVLPVGVGAQEGEEITRSGLRPDAPPYGVRGPYPVGYMSFSDGDAKRPMEGGIWYPAVPAEGVAEAIDYDTGMGDLVPPLGTMPGRAILDGEPDTGNGPYPLIVYSHGLGSTFFAQTYLLEHLASHGFVVMAMYHTGNTQRDNLLAQTPEQQQAFAEAAIDSLVLRPRDVEQTLDYAEVLASPEGAMAGVIDMDRAAAVGWSYGGATSLVVGGARFDFGVLPALCAPGIYASILSTMMCQMHGDDLVGMETHLMDLAGVDGTPGQLWPALADARIDAAVAFQPGGGTAVVSEEGFAGVQLPLLLFRSGNDQAAIPEYNVNRAWQFSGSASKTLVTLENASHLVTGQCPPAATAIPEIFPYCSDSVWDLDRAYDLLNHFTTAFLMATLKADDEAAAALAPDAVSFPGITYNTTGF